MDAQDFHNIQEAYLGVYQELDEGMTMKDFMTARKKRERGEKGKELSPTRRAGIHTPEKKPERDARRDAAYGETGHGGALRPKKVRKAKALGELGEQTDIYDIILSHLLDEGYADTQEAAEAIMANMSEDWRESICEGLGGAKNQGDYDEIERKRKEVRDEHLRKYKSGELPFQKQKKADQAQDFLKKYPKKKK